MLVSHSPSLLVSHTSNDAPTSTHLCGVGSAWAALISFGLLRDPLPLSHRWSEEQAGTEARQQQGVFRSKLPRPEDEDVC